MRHPTRLVWRQLSKLPLGVEISLALLIKIVVLYCLWSAFFAAPKTKHMRLPTQSVEQHLLTNSDTTNSTSTAANTLQTSSPALPIETPKSDKDSKNGSH
ncbi:hypothetical protein LPB67_05920 [Undibacterium sp. Jales W-56]|uniref:cytochrome oxidase putative small subunit CydP n=1 Tax=Undibacterium sp. Jales W-56 TaxID=2897325 RepID=UPI0021CE1A53|nr:cytochrome oxidase putative small subunit CydP [Undibacterium sp. Jales W-56]MCU6433315.1 hypothetical protein [Undibacterium sp. Jales W-56]